MSYVATDSRNICHIVATDVIRCLPQPPGDFEQSISDRAENLWAYVTCNAKIHESCWFFDLGPQKDLPDTKVAKSPILATFCQIPLKIQKKVCPNGLKIDEHT